MQGLFDKLCRGLLPGSDRHVADRAMAALFCGELPLRKRWAVLRHLSRCSYCRIRKETLEGPRAGRILDLYGKTIPDEESRLNRRSREEFAVWLEMQMPLDDPPRRGSRPRRKFPSLKLKADLPALAFSLALGLFMGAAGLHLWWLNHVPHITANALLVRAEKWETMTASAASAVAYQAIRIKSSQAVVNRSELTQTNTPAARNAETLFLEIDATLGSLDAAAGDLYAKHRQPSAAAGRN